MPNGFSCRGQARTILRLALLVIASRRAGGAPLKATPENLHAALASGTRSLGPRSEIGPQKSNFGAERCKAQECGPVCFTGPAPCLYLIAFVKKNLLNYGTTSKATGGRTKMLLLSTKKVHKGETRSRTKAEALEGLSPGQA